jgi:flagellar basal body-associated protein FliL
MINFKGNKGKKNRIILIVVVGVIVAAMIAGAIIAAVSFG